MGENKIKKAVIYPFTASKTPYINYLMWFRKDIVINNITSFEGSGLIGKDIGYSENRYPLGKIVEKFSEIMLEENDILIILPSDNKHIQEIALNIMLKAASLGKNIISLLETSDEDAAKIQESCTMSGAAFENYFGKDKINNITQMNSKSMYTPDVPVIFVGSLIECADQNEVSFGIAKRLQELNYKVSVFGNEIEYNLLGLPSFDFIIKGNYPEYEKIKMINRFFKTIALIEHPDIIVITLPGNMMKFNDIITNDFGVYTYMLSQAVLPDYMVCCVPYGIYDSHSFEQMSDDFLNRFKFKVDCIHATNKILDVSDSVERLKNNVIKLSIQQVEDVIKGFEQSSNIRLYNLLDNYSVRTMVGAMLAELLGE